MKIAFMGTPEFSAYVLKELNNNFDIVWVMSQPSKKRGRGGKISSSPVVEYAVEQKIPYFETSKITEELQKDLDKLEKPDLIVVVAYGVLIPQWFLDLQTLPPLNIHYSLLPKYRGAAPVARAIMNGDKKTGISIMQIVKALDAGDIVIQKELEIKDTDTAESLTWELTKQGTKILTETMPLYLKSEMPLIKQETLEESSYAKKLSKDEAFIDWTLSARNIFNKIRGLNPWPLAISNFREKEIKILETQVRLDALELLKQNSNQNTTNGSKNKFKEGQIIEVSKQHLSILCGEGVLDIISLKPQNKAKMTYKDFINGYKPKVGDIFT